MNLTEDPEIVHWSETHYVYIEKAGPFEETAPQTWQSLHKLVPEISKNNMVTAYMSLYKIQPQMIYRAGVSVLEKPAKLPEGLTYTLFQGGKYSRFVLTGPYSDLPAACGRVFAIVTEHGIELRDDFFIEHYVNDPRTTPEKQLVTEILVPTL